MDYYLINREIQYKILYKKAVEFNCMHKHCLPTKEEWGEDRDSYNKIYKNYIEHTNIFDPFIRKVLKKNHFFKYIKFLHNNY